jgi:hypothetical protein
VTILNRFCVERCPCNDGENRCEVLEKTNKCPVSEFIEYLKVQMGE